MSDQFTAALTLRTSRAALPPGFVQRQRLDAMLDRGVDKTLTVVTGGPGYGKTLAVSAWINHNRLPGPVAWLTAAQSYDVRGLWTDVLNALKSAGALPGSSPLGEITPGPTFGSAELARIVAALTQLPDPVVLVLDDVHELTDDAVVDSISRLIEYRIPQLRLVLVGRTTPPLHLSRLRLADDIVEIGSDDLTYTAAETRRVCAVGGFTLTAHEAEQLFTRTQGWPAGVRLALMGIEESSAPAVDHANNRRVAEYLLEEILERLEPRDRLFLLATSVVEQMSPDLARALSGRADSAQMLDMLVSRNALTVRLSDRPTWFRYHPLLRDLLRERLSAENPDSVPHLYLRAAQWYVSNDEPIVALRFFALARSWQATVKMLGEVALPLILTPQATALVAALAAVYDDPAWRTSAETLIVAMVCDYQRHDFESMRRTADDAERIFASQGIPQPLATRVIVALARIVYSRVSTPSTLVTTSEVLLGMVKDASQREIPAATAYTLIALNNHASGLVWEDRFAEAQIELDAVCVQGAHAGMTLTELSAESYSALVDTLYGNLDQATSRAQWALDTADRKGWVREMQLLASHAALAWVHLYRFELDTAQARIDVGLEASAQGSDVGCRLILHFAAVAVAIAKLDAEAIGLTLNRLDVLERTVGNLPRLLAGWSQAIRAEACMALGKPYEAPHGGNATAGHTGFTTGLHQIVEAKAQLAMNDPAATLKALDFPGLFGRYRSLAAEAAILEAIARGQLRQDALAADNFEKAVVLAEPIGLRRPFVGGNGQIASHLSRFRHLHDDQSAFATELASLRSDGLTAAVPRPPVVQPLTDREMAVLKYLPTMLKSSEIAADLFVSVNTVKTHQRSIYRKLGVATRREAVETARSWAML
ncbi:LuxR family maltose regulon positive regulatory protein [Williamsia muralis]|uniref:LuxR family maltose regulon positive regulatory protein n=1 Tax=Williamsia marianensis TaxID=85044 RepID=A0A495KAX2_WILMA|nr:LuxR C-terminal-related transcriptional regulator [Williamsia muralis]RKR97422.1 LuxR family maltose regulon positive regulatory protein [Williamsia muralis]